MAATCSTPPSSSDSGIELCFLEMEAFAYETGPFAFEPNLSILDVMMWNEPAAVRGALRAARVTPSGDG